MHKLHVRIMGPVRVGIPRAISYYNNYTFYHGFLEGLGVDVLVSDKTTTKIINDGCEYVVSDTCLPVKVFVGHVLNLIEKGCNTIFVPSIQSTGYKVNNCSKIRGLPEIIRNVIDKPINLIEPTLDKTENIGIKDFCIQTANQLGIYDRKLIEWAIKQGWETYNRFIKMCSVGVDYHRAVKCAIKGEEILEENIDVKPLSVVIMAHGYNLFDERISLNLIKKLNKMDVKVFTALDIDRMKSLNSIYELGEIQYWANELDLTGTAAYYLLNNKADGVIALSAFGCGPDSLMVDEITYHAKQRNVPMLHLTIDEHTGEAGFVTRLEAFVDMLIRKRRKQMSEQNTDVRFTNRQITTADRIALER